MAQNSSILVINCGSSSLKYEIFNFPEKTSLCNGTIEKIGEAFSIITHCKKATNITSQVETVIADHTEAFIEMSKLLVAKEFGVLNSPSDISAVGHRVVHGGEHYSKSVIIDETVTNAIEKLGALAPLHNPAHLQGIEAAQKLFPHCPHIAVFDTAFHSTIPRRSFLYALPYSIYEKYGIRRYGFHGTSHHFVARKAAESLNKNLKDCNLITCHLGNGSSIAAIRNGKSINTSMGFTPLSGLMMGTRCGDIDPAIIIYLLNQGMSVKEVDIMLNKKSGLLGISGISNDMRDIEKVAHEDNQAILALEMYAHNVRKFIGAYVAELSNIDMLVFTAGIGQFDTKMRERICKPFKGLGLELDPKQNAIIGKTSGIISSKDSKIKIAVIPTNEELQIAVDSYNLIHG